MKGHTFLRPYFKTIMSSVPTLQKKLEIDQWRQALSVISSKSKHNDGKDVNLFVKNFLETLEGCDVSVSYLIDEISKFENVKSKFWAETDLESIVLDSVRTVGIKFSERQTSLLNDLLLKIYTDGEAYNSVAVSQFSDFKKKLEILPENVSDGIINGAHQLMDWRYNYRQRATMRDRLVKKGGLVVKFVDQFGKYVGVLGDRVGSWLDTARIKSKTLEDMIEFFEDTHRYHDDEVKKIGGGLFFGDVQGRLLAYVRALTGEPIKVADSGDSELRCSFSGDTFSFPSLVSKGSERDNFGMYKAMASYQAGAFMFGSYDFSLSDEKREAFLGGDARSFFDSFRNPGVAISLFELLEFSRIDARLSEKFVGLSKDLDLYKGVVRGEGGLKSGIDGFFQDLTRYVCGTEVDLDDGVVSEFSAVRREGSSSRDSYDAVVRLYEKLEKGFDLEAAVESLDLLSLDLETIAEDREATHLVAKPQNGSLSGKKFRYDEWDDENGKYKEGFVQVVEDEYPHNGANTYVDNLLVEHSVSISQIRNRFEQLRPEEFEVVRRQVSGDVDYDAVVRAQGEIKAGLAPDERLYTRTYKNARSVSALVLSEDSGSLRKFLDLNNPEMRVLDVLKHAKVFFSEALDKVGDRFALATFSGESEKNVEFYWMKRFDQPYDEKVRQTIGAMEPLKQNRDGAGIRHATRVFSEQPEKTRLLFYLMEGVPHDFGYKKEYAIEDTRKALIEAKVNGIVPVVFAFGSGIDDRVRSLSENVMYREIKDPYEVSCMLPDFYARIAF